MQKLIIAITGATGAVLPVRILEKLQSRNVETHLIISEYAKLTIKQETNMKISDLKKMANFYHNLKDMTAVIASGSFKTDGMMIVPCSSKTMSEISCGITNSLISRAADVTLKEKRKLLLAVRETPMHTIQLENMRKLSAIGAIIFPPLPEFYTQPKTLEEVIDNMAERILSYFDAGSPKVWQGKIE